MVYNLLARMLRDPGQAEDLTQEAFLRAFRGLRSFDPQHKFSNWILRIAHNAAIDALRRRAPDLVPMDDDAARWGAAAAVVAAPAGEHGPERLARRDAARALEAAMAQLRPEYREMLVFRYHEDLGYEEIANLTSLPVGTVKSYLHRARAEMAALLRQAGWPSEAGE
jgi:RNA polymerase sigma-70 factor, ECF subfamily